MLFTSCAHRAAHGIRLGRLIGGRESSASQPCCSPSPADSEPAHRVTALPFTLMLVIDRVTSTPCGMATGIFPTRDIAYFSCSLRPRSRALRRRYRCARFAISHHALGGGDNGHTQAVHDLRNVVAALVHTQARTADALDALDDRTTSVVLQGNLQLRLAIFTFTSKFVDVTLILQDLGQWPPSLWKKACSRSTFGHHLRVADAGQHVGDGITHAHVVKLSCRLPAGLGDTGDVTLESQLTDLATAQTKLYGRCHAGDPSIRNDCANGSGWRCAGAFADSRRAA
jgi:hypothetical protein